MNSKIKDIYTHLEKINIDGLILSSPANISYLTEFKSRDAYLLVSSKQNIYFTDSRYTEEVKGNLRSIQVKKIDDTFYKIIAKSCCKLKLKTVGFEEKYLPFIEYQKIREALGKTIKFIPTRNVVEDLRQIKTTRELEKIKKATCITMDALNFIKGLIRPKMTELEVAAELERFIRYQGASSSSFEIIVASGPNSCFPHHLTSSKRIEKDELVLIDIGVDYLGYKSDLTRVIFLNKMKYLYKKIYALVKEAQEKAIKKIRPLIQASKIDLAARQYIAKNGYGGFFNHNLGHGIGLEVHEAPRISTQDNSVLKPGMVFTVEPAIYLPGKFGIRIEDIILVTNKGMEILSGSLDK
jgi:Xaa-Pro aminopeptidase